MSTGKSDALQPPDQSAENRYPRQVSKLIPVAEAALIAGLDEKEFLKGASSGTVRNYTKRSGGVPTSQVANELLAHYRQANPGGVPERDLRHSRAPSEMAAAFRAHGVIKVFEKKGVGTQSILDLAGVIFRLHEIKRDAPDKFGQLEAVIDTFWRDTRPSEEETKRRKGAKR